MERTIVILRGCYGYCIGVVRCLHSVPSFDIPIGTLGWDDGWGVGRPSDKIRDRQGKIDS